MRPGVIGGALVACAAALLAAHVAALLLPAGRTSEIGTWFYLDQELNAPALYSAALLLLVGMLLVDTGGRMRLAGADAWRSWRFLGVVFVFLSVDEAVQFHESLINRMTILLESLNLDHPMLHWPWVIPYASFAVLVGLLSLRFLGSLDATARLRVVLAGAIYVFGAIGMEMLGGWRIETVGEELGEETFWDPMYLAISTFEEACEMGGVSLMLYALAKHRHDRFGAALLGASAIPAFVMLIVGAWAAEQLSQPLTSQIGGRASTLLIAGAYFAAVLVAVFAMRRSGREPTAPAATSALTGGDAGG